MSVAAYIEPHREPSRQNRQSKKLQEFSSANTMRKALHMRLVVKGFRECLSCLKEFLSPDLVNQKCCNGCRNYYKGESK